MPFNHGIARKVPLDAVVEDGRLVARKSARRLAEQLGIDPGTAASALRRLRHRGLLALERDSGPAGRFGLAVYVLGNLEGLTVLAPCGTRPHMVEPDMVRPCGAERDVTSPDTADLAMGTAVTNPSGRPRIKRGVAVAAPGRNGCTAPVAPSGQGALDLGLGTP